jgi:hypothetical protein
MSDDRDGGRPPLDEVLDALKDIYLTLRHTSRSSARSGRWACSSASLPFWKIAGSPCRSLDQDAGDRNRRRR